VRVSIDNRFPDGRGFVVQRHVQQMGIEYHCIASFWYYFYNRRGIVDVGDYRFWMLRRVPVASRNKGQTPLVRLQIFCIIMYLDEEVGSVGMIDTQDMPNV
jgi:hypothetical protein